LALTPGILEFICCVIATRRSQKGPFDENKVAETGKTVHSGSQTQLLLYMPAALEIQVFSVRHIHFNATM